MIHSYLERFIHGKLSVIISPNWAVSLPLVTYFRLHDGCYPSIMSFIWYTYRIIILIVNKEERKSSAPKSKQLKVHSFWLLGGVTDLRN